MKQKLFALALLSVFLFGCTGEKPFIIEGDENNSGGGGAPTNASYVTMSLDANLSAERVLTAGNNITIVDGGPNGNVIISSTDTNWQTSFPLLDLNLALSYYKQTDANTVFVKRDGTSTLTGNWNAGNFRIIAKDLNANDDVNAGRFLRANGDRLCNATTCYDIDDLNNTSAGGVTGIFEGANINVNSNIGNVLVGVDDANLALTFYKQTDLNNNGLFIKTSDSNNTGRLDFEVIANPPWITGIQANGQYIRQDGTSVTTASIPFVEGLNLPNNIDINFGTNNQRRIRSDSNGLRIDPEQNGTGFVDIRNSGMKIENIGIGNSPPSQTQLIFGSVTSSTFNRAFSVDLNYIGTAAGFRALNFTGIYTGATGGSPNPDARNVGIIQFDVNRNNSTVYGMEGVVTTKPDFNFTSTGTNTWRGIQGEVETGANFNLISGTINSASVFGDICPIINVIGGTFRCWAGLFAADVQINNPSKLLLEGTLTSKGDTFMDYNSTAGKMQFFVDSNSSPKVSIDANLVVHTNIIPDVNNASQIGSSTKKFSDSWVINSHVGDLIFSNGLYITEPEDTTLCLYNSLKIKVRCLTNAFMQEDFDTSARGLLVLGAKAGVTCTTVCESHGLSCSQTINLAGVPSACIPCKGDVNLDGNVNPSDYGAIQSRFCTKPNCGKGTIYDIDKDGIIFEQDSNYVLNNFGVCSEALLDHTCWCE